MYRSFRGVGSCFGFGGGFMPMIGMGILMVLVVIAAILIIRKIAGKNKNQAYDASIEELKTRFVKGEITEEEYLRMKKLISQ